MAGVKIRGKGNGSEITVTDPVHLDAVKALQERRFETGRTDTWYNARSRFGGTADPVIISTFIRTRARMNREEAEALYQFDWLSARIVDQMARDSTREWISFKHDKDPEKAERLRKEDDRLNGRTLFMEASTWARLHGGSLLVVGAWDGQDPEEPLEVEKIRKILFAHVVDRWLAFPTEWYRDPLDPLFGQISLYRINRLTPVGAPSEVVQESRVIRFEGDMLPPFARVRNWNWSASVLDKVYDALRNWGISNQAAASIIPSFITVAMQIGNLQQLIQNKDFSTIRARMAEFAGQMATHNMAFYGEGEKLEKMGTPVAGLPDLMDKFMQIISGASDIPKSLLFQAETGSMGGNAANTDQDNWYNKVASFQEVVLRPKIRRWLDMVGVPIGLAPGEVEFEFMSLDNPTPNQQAELYLKTMQGDQIAINSGMVDAPERLGLYRFGGDKFDATPPVVDTDRMEKFLEQLEEEPVVAHDPRAEEGQELEQKQLSMEQQEESFDGEGNPNENRLNSADMFILLDSIKANGGVTREDFEKLEQMIRDNSALLGSDLEEHDEPKKKKKRKKGSGGEDNGGGDYGDAKQSPEMQNRLSAKIKKLMEEGKSQDQAVAIAHSMLGLSRDSVDLPSGALVAPETALAPVETQDSGQLPHPPEGIGLNTVEHKIWAVVKADNDDGVVLERLEEALPSGDFSTALEGLLKQGHLVEKEGNLCLPDESK